MSITANRRRVARCVVIALVTALLALAVPATPASAVTAEEVLAQQLFDQLNDERAARGLAPLALDNRLEGASASWSASMSSRQNLVHSSDGRAEIIARGWWAGQITEAWMQSSGHRNLIVDPNLGRAGVGVVCDGNGQIWATVQFFRIDTSLGTLSASSASPAVTPNNAGSDCGDSAAISQVRRLYLAYFRRESDQSGLAFWVAELSEGSSLGHVSHAFATSPEFNHLYGHLDARSFVRRVYVNVLGREPDEAGYGYWVGLMAQGLTRGEVMIGFSESPEFRAGSGIG